MTTPADTKANAEYVPVSEQPRATPVFQLQGALRNVYAEGRCRRLPAGPAATLGKRVSAFFEAPQAQSQPLVGMLPFDPDADDALYQPRQLQHAPPAATAEAKLFNSAHVVAAEPAPDIWHEAVARCRADLAPREGNSNGLRKIVLARSLRVQANAPVHLGRLARHLGDDPSATSYVVPLPTARNEAPAWLVGATPELLISRRGDTVVSNPLAGSAPRRADTAADNAAAEALLASGKDQDEHRYVIEAIADTLAPFCQQLHVPPQPSLQATRTMWHLGTRIEGRLNNVDVCASELAGRLHPTPAVCGTPRRQALAAIRRLEPVDRGFYAGAVGWADARGDGDWYVAIRCARIQGRTMRLFAGAGIVADSQPALEVQETNAKFRAMLDALGIDGRNSL